MNLQTVITNLRNTIAGKEKFLEEVKQAMLNTQGTSHHVAATTARSLENLVECGVQGINLSWQQNPDRSGGQFTEEEINRANEWR